jgi:hypothetical protein
MYGQKNIKFSFNVHNLGNLSITLLLLPLSLLLLLPLLLLLLQDITQVSVKIRPFLFFV